MVLDLVNNNNNHITHYHQALHNARVRLIARARSCKPLLS